ncbi:MAG: TetR family transcriptional regulator [Dehalococcoidia bacterium]
MAQGNPRSYDSSRRKAAAAATRHRILGEARRLFIERGYEATTIAAIAAAAGVAPDTVYATVGRKPVLFRLLVEAAISGTSEAVPALEREYVRRVRASTVAAEKLDLYAHAITAVQERLAPLFLVLREAAPAHPELGQLWHEIGERRAQNMRMFAADMAATGMLRPGVEVEELADVVWTTNSAELYSLFVFERGWPPARFAAWLSAAWRRLFLD